MGRNLSKNLFEGCYHTGNNERAFTKTIERITMTVPYWVKDAVFYQIFPDRFANGDTTNDPPNVQAWGSKPTIWEFQGGDLSGIIQHFDYLLDLGINAIYLNPIFQSTSNHRYNITDYYKIDHKLGNLKIFHDLLNLAHSNNVRVILDGVFNHCGRGFMAFNDLMENQEYSPYKDWFHVHHFPVNAYANPETTDYDAWWGFSSLPKLNTQNPGVRQYIFDVARYWLEQGADGWRLDVPNEIDDDLFWEEFRHVVKKANRDAYLVGEIWDGDPRWVGEQHFDGLLNYPLRMSLIDLMNGKIHVSDFAKQIDSLLSLYPRENTYAMYLPLGSHDTERILSLLDDSVEKVKLSYLFLFTFPGAPGIYYGDEIGMTGGKDPDCRKAFVWKEEQWNRELLEWMKTLISLRKDQTVLRRGDFKVVEVLDKENCYAYSRSLDGAHCLVVLNAGNSRRYLKLRVGNLWKDGRVVRNLLGNSEYIIANDSITITINAWEGVVIS